MKLNQKQYNEFMNNRLNVKSKQNKYHNKKTYYNSYKFDSIKERNYYIYLNELEDKGKIKDLQLQVKFELQPSFKLNGETIRAINYIADFVYVDLDINKKMVIDVKGYRTKEYALKKKLFLYKYQDVVFKEV